MHGCSRVGCTGLDSFLWQPPTPTLWGTKRNYLCYYFFSRKLHLQLEFGGGSVTILTTLNQNTERTETGKVIKTPATKNTANKAKVTNKAVEIRNNAIINLAIRFSDLLDSFNVKALHD